MTWVSRDSQSEERKGAAEMQMLSFKEMRALYRLSGADKSVRGAAERLTKIMRKMSRQDGAEDALFGQNGKRAVSGRLM